MPATAGAAARLTRAACRELGLAAWQDPHNTDSRFTRARLRNEVLPLLEDVLGGGVAEALARTATALREDTGLIDTLAAQALPDVVADPVCWPRAWPRCPTRSDAG